MSTISFHAGRGPDGRAAGRPWGGRMLSSREQAADPGQLAQAVKRLYWDAGSTSMTGRQRDAYLLGLVKSRYPAALSTFGELALRALFRRPEPPACSWDALRMLAAANVDDPMPTPTPVLRALLGSMCSRCKVHYQAQEVAEREQAHVASLEAAGYAAEDAAYQRPGDPRATGVIWPAGRGPAGVVASARLAARRTPPPSYYRPGRPARS